MLQLIARENSKPEVGTFLIENKDFFKGKITVDWVNSTQEKKIRQQFKINSLPLLVYSRKEGKRFFAGKDIISFLLDFMNSETTEVDREENYDDWMQSEVDNFRSKKKKNQPIDDDSDEEVDYNKKISQFRLNREKIKVPKPSGKKSNVFPEDKFKEAISENHFKPTAISDEDLEHEEFMEMLGKL